MRHLLLTGTLIVLAASSVSAQNVYTYPYSISIYAGEAGVEGAENGQGTSARFYTPEGIAIDKSGNLFVADSNNGTIRKITPAGMVSTFAGQAGNYGNLDGPGDKAMFDGLEGIGMDASGTIYVADSGSYTIRKITPAGVVSTFAGKPFVSGGKDGTGKAATFEGPFGVTVDSKGNVYISVYEASNIRKITPDGVVTTFAGMPDNTAGVTGSKDGTGPAAQFFYPAGLAVDDSDNIYVADSGNDTIRKITPAGVVTTIAGTAGVQGSVDGTGKNAAFDSPEGLTVDASGNIFVADSFNSLIRKITPAGVVSTVAGKPGVSGAKVGVGVAARLGFPGGLVFDQSGDLFIADFGKDVIFKGIPVPVPTITSSTSLSGAANTPLTYQVMADNSPTSFSLAGTLPTGLQFSTATGLLSGTPTQAGIFILTLGASNSVGTGTASLTLTIAQADQTITFATIPTQQFAIPSPKVTLAATASSGLPVTFTVTDGPGKITGDSLSFTAARTVTVQADQAGDATYLAAPSVLQSLVVKKISQTISFPQLPNVGVQVQPFILNATASSGLPVKFTLSSGPATISGQIITFSGQPGTVRIVASQAGNTKYSAAPKVTQTFNVDSAQTVQFPGAPPTATGTVTVSLVPAKILSGWRFAGETTWHASGITIGNLEPGLRMVQFRPVPGYITPSAQPVTASNGTPSTLTAEYAQTPRGARGGLSIRFLPHAAALAGVGQWRFFGEGDSKWSNSGDSRTGLIPGTYLVEFKPVDGYTTPENALVPVLSPDEAKGVPAITVETVNYAIPISFGATPAVLSLDYVNSSPKFPYPYVGQIRSDAGTSSGFVVRQRVVATAAHVVFDGVKQTYITGVQWLFQRDAGTYEPEPLIPLGSFIYTSYSTYAKKDKSGVASISSRISDAAALYFVTDAGRGGYSGYLASNASPNPYLNSATSQKILVGYPTEGLPAAEQGRIHATPAIIAALDQVKSSAGNPLSVYTTNALSSVGGNSGGPLCVEDASGQFYPAAIYLGGSTTLTSVRSIDKKVTHLFDLADGTADQTDPGTVDLNSSNSGSGELLATLQVVLGPAAAVNAGAGWMLSPSGTTKASGASAPDLTVDDGAYQIYFTTVPGYVTPAVFEIILTGDQSTDGKVTTLNFTYFKKQTITFPVPTPAAFSKATTYQLGATASSKLAVAYTTSTASTVKSISATGLVTFAKAGSVTITASQKGSSVYAPATSVSQTFVVGK